MWLFVPATFRNRPPVRSCAAIHHASPNHSFFNSSSLEIVPSARQAARLVRFAITGDVPSAAFTNIAASSASVKNTSSAMFWEPIALLNYSEDGGLANSQVSSTHTWTPTKLPNGIIGQVNRPSPEKRGLSECGFSRVETMWF